MEEKHDTSRNIIIAILVIAIIAVLGYFIYTSTLDNEEEAIPNEVEDTVPEVTNDEFDEVGAYSGMETYGDEEATGTVELILNDDKTASLALAYDDTKEYTGTYTKNSDKITFTADDENSSDNDGMVEDTIDDITNNEDDNENTNSNNTTFTFTISDDTLYFTSDETGEEIKLDKVSTNTLQYLEK